jgi:hypothetical protein
MAARVILLLSLLFLLFITTAQAQAGIKRPAPTPEQGDAYQPRAARKVIRTARATTYIYIDMPRIPFLTNKKKKR